MVDFSLFQQFPILQLVWESPNYITVLRLLRSNPSSLLECCQRKIFLKIHNSSSRVLETHLKISNTKY